MKKINCFILTSILVVQKASMQVPSHHSVQPQIQQIRREQALRFTYEPKVMIAVA